MLLMKISVTVTRTMVAFTIRADDDSAPQLYMLAGSLVMHIRRLLDTLETVPLRCYVARS